jgi:hypothetical protein
MRPQNWDRYSFGAWLKTAAERLHRNNLAVALPTSSLALPGVCCGKKELSTIILRLRPSEPLPQPSSRVKNCMEWIDRRTLNLVIRMVALQPVR